MGFGGHQRVLQTVFGAPDLVFGVPDLVLGVWGPPEDRLYGSLVIFDGF